MEGIQSRHKKWPRPLRPAGIFTQRFGGRILLSSRCMAVRTPIELSYESPKEARNTESLFYYLSTVPVWLAAIELLWVPVVAVCTYLFLGMPTPTRYQYFVMGSIAMLPAATGMVLEVIMMLWLFHKKPALHPNSWVVPILGFILCCGECGFALYRFL